jgi:hypothetical protein
MVIITRKFFIFPQFFYLSSSCFIILYYTITMSTSLISPESDPFVSPNSNPEEIIIVAKHGGGKPKNIIWNYFEHNALKHPGHFDAKCKFCGTYWRNGIVKNLQVHLASKCENIDIETKNKFMHYVATRDGIINEDHMEIGDNRNEELSEEQVALIDRSILKAFVMCAIPFRIIENPYFIYVLKKLQPNYNSPSRERLTADLLSEESIRTEIKINNYIEKEENLTLGIKKYLKYLKFYMNLMV